MTRLLDFLVIGATLAVLVAFGVVIYQDWRWNKKQRRRNQKDSF
jgi:hypothetical protein